MNKYGGNKVSSVKSAVISGMVSAIIAVAFYQYEIKPKIQILETSLEEAKKKLVRRIDFADVQGQNASASARRLTNSSFDGRCAPDKLLIDLNKGTVDGVGVLADFDKVLDHFRPCVHFMNDDGEAMMRNALSEKKDWTIPIAATSAPIYFASSADARRFIRFHLEGGGHRIVSGSKFLGFYNSGIESIEKLLGEPVLKSKNEYSVEVMSMNQDALTASYKTSPHVRLYEASYGCIIVDYFGGPGTKKDLFARAIEMSSNKCSQHRGSIEKTLSSSFPLDK